MYNFTSHITTICFSKKKQFSKHLINIAKIFLTDSLNQIVKVFFFNYFYRKWSWYFLFEYLFFRLGLKEDFMLGNPNAQRIPLKKLFCSKSSPRLILSIFEQKVFLSGMCCALQFPNIKSSRCQFHFNIFDLDVLFKKITKYCVFCQNYLTKRKHFSFFSFFLYIWWSFLLKKWTYFILLSFCKFFV